MNTTGIAVIVYILWMVALLTVFLFVRVSALVKREVRTNNFRADGSDVSKFAERLARTHANCYESAPMVLGILLLALATDQIHVTNGLALYVVAARILQGLVHMLSTNAHMVRLRFVLFIAQIVIITLWSIQFLKIFMSNTF
ncbi:MAPEG family protein [Marinicella sp. W31]|uniref:MAPEG family protein n=1 Tax=Marinicella sp. W31 TaxID=3023713 RepID=UPI0037579C60